MPGIFLQVYPFILNTTKRAASAREPLRRYHVCSTHMPEHVQTDELTDKVIRVIAHTQRIPPESISLDSTFEELNIDSLDGINIVFEIEKEFDIEIPDEGVQNLRSVRQTVEGVRRLVEEKSQAVPPGAA